MLNKVQNQTELLNLSNHKALGGWVIVAPANIVESGVTSRATKFEDRPDVGILVSVGEEVSNETELSVGDIVFFGKYSHVQVTHDEINYLVMRYEDIYCVANK